jgi:hypothetical protein
MEQRLADLERRVRLLTAALVLAIGGLVALALCGAAATPPDGVFGKLTANEIVLESADGQCRLRLDGKDASISAWQSGHGETTLSPGEVRARGGTNGAKGVPLGRDTTTVLSGAGLRHDLFAWPGPTSTPRMEALPQPQSPQVGPLPPRILPAPELPSPWPPYFYPDGRVWFIDRGGNDGLSGSVHP